MLNVFRENLRHLKWILLLVVFSFILTIYAVWGGGVSRNDSSQNGAESWAARVDGEVISIQEFQTEARNLDASYRQLLGAQYDQQRAFLRVGQAAIDRLINESLLEKEASRCPGTFCAPWQCPWSCCRSRHSSQRPPRHRRGRR